MEKKAHEGWSEHDDRTCQPRQVPCSNAAVLHPTIIANGSIRGFTAQLGFAVTQVKIKKILIHQLKPCNHWQQRNDREDSAGEGEDGGITHSGFFSPSWMGDRGPERELRFWSEVLTEVKPEPGSSGEQLPSWKSSLWRLLIVVGWMGSSTDDIQLSSFSCSPPSPSSSSCSSSSSSKPGARWSLARVPSTTGSPGGRASSSCRLWTRLGRGTLSCSVTCP